MRRFLAVIASVFLLLALSLVPADAQDGRGKSRLGPIGKSDLTCHRFWRCGPSGCGWHKVCGACADRFSCWPLYGAYGPYGGVGYWGAYSADLWGIAPPR
jgi:hypothetical protein